MASQAPAQEREFAAQSEWGREAAAAGRGGQGRGHRSSRGVSAGGPVRGQAGRAMAEGEGRSPLHNPAAAALGTPRTVRPPEKRRGVRPARPPRPAPAVGAPPPPGGSAAPPGRAGPAPPLPHPAAARGSLTFCVAADHHARHSRLVRLHGPGRRRHRRCGTLSSPGPGGGLRKESHRRAAVHARPTLAEAGLARSAAAPAPPHPAGARAAAPPHPPPLSGLRAPWLRPHTAPCGRGPSLRARPESGWPRPSGPNPRLAHALARALPEATPNAGRGAAEFGKGRPAPPRARPLLTLWSAEAAPPRHVIVSQTWEGEARGWPAFSILQHVPHLATSAPGARVAAAHGTLLPFR